MSRGEAGGAVSHLHHHLQREGADGDAERLTRGESAFRWPGSPEHDDGREEPAAAYGCMVCVWMPVWVYTTTPDYTLGARVPPRWSRRVGHSGPE